MPLPTHKTSANMEEVQACTHLTLPLGAGCTAPPPTPVRRPDLSAVADTLSSDDDTFWPSAPGLRHTFCNSVGYVDDIDDNGMKCSSSGIMCQNSTPPSRAELDELALYLMQQSLLSTPTLLASPTSRRQKRGILPGSGAGASEGAVDQSSGNKKATQCLVVGGRPSTYSFSTEGFCEESKTGIRRVCEEEGAFFVQITDVGKASLFQVDHLFTQCPSMNRVCLIGSCPLVPISELMTTIQSHESSIFSSCRQEDGEFKLSFELPLLLQDAPTVEATMDANFREAMIKFANLLVEISKELLKFLLEDICYETRNNLRCHSLKPLLYLYKYGGQEPHVSRRDEDVVLSIISHGDANHECRESLLVILGSHIQIWSKGMFKSPTLLSLCNLVDNEVCIQIDLVYEF